MAFVYWIHLPEHTNPRTQGYIGRTIKSFKTRYSAHKTSAKNGSQMIVHKAMRKYGKDILHIVLHEDTPEACELIEWMYRPTPNIAWNTLIGGECGWCGLKRSPKSIAKRKETMSKYSPILPWEKPNSNIHLWTMAQYIYDRIEEGYNQMSIAKAIDVSDSSLNNVCIKFKDGWIPNKDSKWLEFKNSQLFANVDFDYEADKRLPWKHHLAIKQIWLNAECLYSLTGRGEKRKYERENGLPFKCLNTIFRKFKKGWNPFEDYLYQSWIKEQRTLNENS